MRPNQNSAFGLACVQVCHFHFIASFPILTVHVIEHWQDS